MDVRNVVWDQWLERYTLAELLFQSGDYAAALPWWRDGLWIHRDEPQLAAIVELRQAQIHDRLGDRQEAARHYARYLELWKHADPPLQAIVEEARHRLAQIAAPRA